jgi:branched-chain amino acid transport system ATP-binding protein
VTAVPPALALTDIVAGYNGGVVVDGVSVAVQPGSVAALLGANGAGKTTLLRVAAGLLRPAAGVVEIHGRPCTTLPAYERTRRGLCLVPEGRGIFRDLTVHENLRLQLPPGCARDGIDAGLGAFPFLAGRLNQVAGAMSGGEQQMLALARCYIARPSVILVDEVSIGLAPKIVDRIFESLRDIAATGIAILLVEQYVTRALELADTAHVLTRGSLRFSGPAAALDAGDLFVDYLGGEPIHTTTRRPS